VTDLLNVWDYERAAAEKLDPGPLAYFAAGAGDEWTLGENVAAFRRWTLRPRVLCDVENVSTATTVLGTEVALPILVAPMAYQRLAHPDGEPAMARAAAAAGTIMCVSTVATASPQEIADAAPEATRWYQVYVFRDPGVTRAFVDQAVDAGYKALALTADTPYLGRRERDVRTGWKIPVDVEVPAMVAALGEMHSMSVAEQFGLFSPSVSWRDVEMLASESKLPVLVKGVHTAEDAKLAVDHGAAGVIVSNHGGRQLDGVPATLDMLPEIAEAVGDRVDVLLDGGIRRGTDVVKALALGARAVLAGRAVLWGLAVDGEEGARRVLELLRDELWLALALSGCNAPDAVTRAHVARAV
jgi:isopentenyl diphosphate isomerase/L-lactate dehydrogenase-like FMN-dependent dehydrogenase